MNKFNVCITDDDADDYLFLHQAFESLNSQFRLKHITNGVELLEYLFYLKKKNRKLPDLILLDFNMPRMNGLEVLKLLRETDTFTAIPVIIYSTMNDSEQRDELFLHGANGFVTKSSSLAGISAFAEKVIGFLNKTNEIPGKQKVYLTLK
jgi:two-component system response regulator